MIQRIVRKALWGLFFFENFCPYLDIRGLAAVSSSFSQHFVVHLEDTMWCISMQKVLPFLLDTKTFGKRVISTIHGECEIIWTTREKPDFMRVCAA